MRLRARWIFPGDSPPIENGCIEIANGHVQRLIDESRAADLDLGQMAIIPGLINAHTHLEFSHFTQPLQPLDQFPEWIRNVIASRRDFTGSPAHSLQRGLTESRHSGVTGIGEIATSNELCRDVFRSSPIAPRTLVFREILGLHPDRIESQLAEANSFLAQQPTPEPMQRGLSPHAPYSLHPDLFRRLCDVAGNRRVTVAMHLAESPAELQLLRSGDGPLQELLTALGIWQPKEFRTRLKPYDFLQRLSELERVLVIHGNFLDEDEVQLLSQHPQMSVVYCPRTHAAMQEGQHPWQKLLREGINVAIGTDSRASNPDLSLWNELRFLQQQHPQIPAEELLQLGTLNGARALGWTDVGHLQPGAIADLCVIRLNPEDQHHPNQLFQGEVCGVLQQGTWVRSIV
ncbi:amidohydrolase family protein [Planctomicrobium sp. SH664]|uniref:amidohydrolase family protein n=1 Tax=Planctomicrobium sp. SH664 TaxID=3448125 RepID=UPI003F5CBC28